MSQTRRRPRALETVAAFALAWLVFLVLYLAGRPIGTDDFWWHLKLGEIYAQLGPSIAIDPLLHTATQPPDPASWLFDVAAYLLHTGLGFHGVRIVHACFVALILWQTYGLFRRASGSRMVAMTAGAVWLALSWYRLIQLRPHLVSILALMLLVRLLFEPVFEPGRPLRWWRIALAMVVLLLWANSHALYILGPLLCGGAVAGIALRAALATWAGKRLVRNPETEPDPTIESWRSPRATLFGLGTATGLGLLMTMLNPRGAARHLTFLKSSGEEAIWRIKDEWTPFDPIHWSDANPALSLISMALVDTLFIGVALLAVVGVIRALREPSGKNLAAIDPVILGFSAAAFVAISAAVRFEWLAVFPLLFLAGRARDLLHRRPGAARPLRAACAALCAAIAVAVPTTSGYAERTARVPRNVARYLEKPIDGFKYYSQGVVFLRDSGLEGNLFNSYFMGGYLGYWLAPSLKTFVGGTLNYPQRVAAEHRAIAAFDGTDLGASPLALLEKNSVDVFFGIGLPIGGSPNRRMLYTGSNLEGAPGWKLVFRSLRTAIYLRTNERNAENLERVITLYGAEGVPFDPALGFDAGRVIRERPRWAVRRGLVPANHARLIAESARADRPPGAREAALDQLGDMYAAGGAYRLLIENDQKLLAIAPDDRRALQRLIYAELRLDRIDLAQEHLQHLMQVAGDDPRSRAFAIGVDRYVEARRRHPGLGPTEGSPGPPSGILNRLPLFTVAEATRAIGG